MREKESTLTAKGFYVEDVATTKYTNEDGVSFVITGDSTAKEQNEKGFDGRLLELKSTYAGVSNFDFITVLNLEDEYNKITKDNPDHTKKRSEILEMRRRLMDRFRLKNQ